MKVPLVRGCGCVHEEYLGVQYLVRECPVHRRDLMRSREANRHIIEQLKKKR